MAISFREALYRLEDRRVKATRPLIPPQILQEDLPLYVSCITATVPILTEYTTTSTLSAAQTVLEARKAGENILRSNDDRLMVVVG